MTTPVFHLLEPKSLKLSFTCHSSKFCTIYLHESGHFSSLWFRPSLFLTCITLIAPYQVSQLYFYLLLLQPLTVPSHDRSKGDPFIFLMFIHFLRDRMWVGERKREGDTKSKAGSKFWAVSTEPDAGFKNQTAWATQVPQGDPFEV